MKEFNRIWRLLPSSPNVSVGDLFLFKKENDRFPTTTFGNDNESGNENNRFPNAAGRLTLGNDDFMKKEGHPELVSGSTSWVVNRGFTLIELLVVVLIIGILAGVALPQYNVAVEKSRLGAMIPNIKTLKNAAELYYMANGSYIDDVSVLDVGEISGCSVGINNGQIYCGNNGWYDWHIYGGGNDEGSAGYTRPKGEFKTGIVMYGDHSQTPGVVECWAKSDDTVAKRVCKSMGGVESRTQTCPPSVGTCQIYRLP